MKKRAKREFRIIKHLPIKPLHTVLNLFVVGLLVVSAVAQVEPPFGANPFEPEEVSPLMLFIGDLHPLSVHFPLALAFAAFLFELIFLASKNERWRTSAFHTLVLGATVSILTILTGLVAGSNGPFFAEDLEILNTHRVFGLASSGLLLLTTYFAAQVRLKKRENLLWSYRTALAVTTICVFIAGHFGAKLSGLSPF